MQMYFTNHYYGRNMLEKDKFHNVDIHVFVYKYNVSKHPNFDYLINMHKNYNDI